jgi:PDZ domain-containing secreted protein
MRVLLRLSLLLLNCFICSCATSNTSYLSDAAVKSSSDRFDRLQTENYSTEKYINSPNLKNTSTNERIYLGLGVATCIHANLKGVYVVYLNQNSILTAKGMAVKDRIIEFQGYSMSTAQAVSNLLKKTMPNTPVSMKFVRNNRIASIQVIPPTVIYSQSRIDEISTSYEKPCRKIGLVDIN